MLEGTLAWLWDTIAGPVLHALGHTTTPTVGQDWPRVWWCPTGALTVLPIHAAANHADSGAAVLDRVISSYTPTLAALLHARRPPAQTTDPTRTPVLAIGMPHTPTPAGLPDLPGVGQELADLRRHLTRPAPVVKVGPEATAAEVLALLPDHPWAHLACHGGQNLADPSRGAIYLHDGPVTVAQITALRPYDAQLAVLSACQTAIGGVELPDEAIHLAAAFQLAGYRQVIATQWTISDQHAPHITDAFYAALTTDGTPDPTHAAVALHHTLRETRTTHPGQPLLWAPYLHIGP